MKSNDILEKGKIFICSINLLEKVEENLWINLLD